MLQVDLILYTLMLHQLFCCDLYGTNWMQRAPSEGLQEGESDCLRQLYSYPKPNKYTTVRRHEEGF